MDCYIILLCLIIIFNSGIYSDILALNGEFLECIESLWFFNEMQL